MLSKNIRFESIVDCIKITFYQKNGKLMRNDRVIARNSLYKMAQTAYRQSTLIKSSSGYMEVHYNNINFTDNIDLLFKFDIDCKLNVIFNNCKFKNLQLIHKKFNVSLCFYNCKFQEKTIFTYTNFSNQSVFKDCIFNKYTDFQDVDFDNVSFYNSTFRDDVRFCGASFDKSIFARVQFHRFVDFTMTSIDKNKTSFMGCRTGYTIDDMRKLAADKIDSLRESYCIIKSILISEHNILEAANWRKLELYAKEVELESKKSKKFAREWIDKWQLLFYRITSNHHTDLLKSFHSLLVVIGIFAFLNIVIIIGFNCYCLQNVSLYPYALIAHYNAIIKHFLNCNYISLLAINLVLVVVFILLFCFTFCNKLRKIIIFLSYFLVLFLLISLPQYIIPTISIFTDKRPFLDPLSIIGGIYTILFATMFFSFIKTARKNSIVPN